ncbi:MAG: L-aspartate oxidase [Oligoflexia bacterium]|nr:L-aspartate oxidase [Oligoflexia bacterium]
MSASVSVQKSDFLVIGSGIAGLFFALKAARLGTVTVLAKGSATHTATAMAQGGIASVTGQDDSFDSHIKDTVVAGAGLCNEEIVKMCVSQAPARIRDLIEYGVVFNKTTGSDLFDLTREGGHSQKRILHSFDQTGLAIQNALLAACAKNSNIKILEYQMAIDLIIDKKINPLKTGPTQCLGAYVLDTKNNQVQTQISRFTILATGGAGKVYLYTSNWDGATGDGIAMARRAGCRVANMEFLQFHPTCLYHPQARNFLITEALRGEGAHLILENGERFMPKYHEKAELAPRDIVARAIDAEIKRTGQDCVFLDVTHMPAVELKTRFPGVYERCLKYGIDMTVQPIPVVPAAHYICGGVWTKENAETDINHLFAIGETAHTGLHGANRLASNSLMEATVFAHNAVEYIEQHFLDYPELNMKVKEWDHGEAVNPDEMIVISHNWDEIRRLMWNYVGIVRSTKRLERAHNRIKVLQDEIKEYYWNFRVNKDLLELRNIALIAELVIESALSRKESRGIHFTLDYPDTNQKFASDTVI